MSAASTLTEEIINDSEYAWGWHCNLACAITDERPEMSHEDANRIAARQMIYLFGVDVTKFPQWKSFEWA